MEKHNKVINPMHFSGKTQQSNKPNAF